MTDAQDFDVRKVVFLPTAQYDLDNPWLPNARGILRIQAALACLEEHPDAYLVIGGGYANHRGVTYADRMLAYIATNHDWAIRRLMVVTGLYNRTVDDIFQATLIMGGIIEQASGTLVPSQSTMYFCSEEEHFGRSAATIAALGFRPVHVPSGGDTSIYDHRDIAMAQELVPGKILGLGPEAVEWFEVAKANAATQADYCQAWADTHPDEDQEWYERIVRLLQELSGRVYIESSALPRPTRPPIPTFLPREKTI